MGYRFFAALLFFAADFLPLAPFLLAPAFFAAVFFAAPVFFAPPVFFAAAPVAATAFFAPPGFAALLADGLRPPVLPVTASATFEPMKPATPPTTPMAVL